MALRGSVVLACAWPYLRKHGADLVARIRMHGWGSRVAGSSGCPGGEPGSQLPNRAL